MDELIYNKSKHLKNQFSPIPKGVSPNLLCEDI